MLDDLTEGFDDPFDIDQLQPLEEEAPEELDASVHEVVEEEEVERPMFLLERIYPAPEPDMVQSMAVANGTIVMLLDNNRIIRRTPRGVEEIAFKRGTNENATKIFVDPSGAHIFITTESARNYYYQAGTKMKAPKLLEKWRLCIESMAFLLPLEELRGDERGQILPLHGGPHHADPRVNWGLLVGTQDGRLIETTLELRDKTIQEVVPDSMFDRAPISGIDGSIDWEAVAGSGRDVFPRYYIVCAASSIKMDFVRYSLESPMTPNSTSVRLPFACDSWLQFSYLADSPWFAWASGSGVYHGPFPATQSSQDALTFHDHPTGTKSQDGVIVPFPRGLAVTAFHYLTLYEDRLQAWCHLNEELIRDRVTLSALTHLEIPGDHEGPRHYQCIATDPVTGHVFVAAHAEIYRVETYSEDRRISAIYLEKATKLIGEVSRSSAINLKDPKIHKAGSMFQLAHTHAKSDEQRQLVITTQGDCEFEIGRFHEAAKLWARAGKAFEEVTLKFMDRRDVLKTYLQEKLSVLDRRANRGNAEATSDIEKTQRTLLCTWLVELYLDQLSELEYEEEAGLVRDLEEELSQFLIDHQGALKNNVIVELLRTHGRGDLLVRYATAIGEMDSVVSHYILQGRWMEAVTALFKQKKTELYYKYSPSIIKHRPQELIKDWIRKDNDPECRLDPVELLPALMNYRPGPPGPDGTVENCALRYLKHCIVSLDNQATPLHNYMVATLARLGDEDELLLFLQDEDSRYDPRYALRVCMAENQARACIAIYNSLGMYEEAVDLALRYSPDNPELAKDSARMASKKHADPDVTKRLWIRIVTRIVQRHAQSKNSQVDKKLIKHVFAECDTSSERPPICVEDILPCFPDFSCIDDFRDEIICTLTKTQRKHERMREDMKQSGSTAENLRKEIGEWRNRHCLIQRTQLCAICGQPLFMQAFYIFPCRHTFHADCILQRALEDYPFELRAHIRALHQLAEPPLLSSEDLDPSSQSNTPHTHSHFRLPGAQMIRNTLMNIGSQLTTHSDSAPHEGNDEVSPNMEEEGGARDELLAGCGLDEGREDVMSSIMEEYRGLSPDQADEKLDALLAKECPMCGNPMIDSISTPFIDPLNESETQRSWHIAPNWDSYEYY
eukprot:gnl/Trimastix_PCT/3878.p1 GENE.gnl/Trimastix_PCT/3878~~gnl/Trimastix_PCT/3878.p1  ORF type:complete len:1128 (-),score=305.69 gnl/Trimastix_PCT/3878:97-3480(-)